MGGLSATMSDSPQMVLGRQNKHLTEMTVGRFPRRDASISIAESSRGPDQLISRIAAPHTSLFQRL